MEEGTEEILLTIRRLLSGHTDRDEEARILSILEHTDAAQLNELLLELDVGRLISSVDDRVFGPDNRTALFDLVSVQRLGDLGVDARVALVNALQEGRTDRQREEALRNIFVGTGGADLTALKNSIDTGGDYRDLQQLIFTDIDDEEIRAEILAHIQREAEPGAPQADVKVLSDIDDTLYSSLNDKRYPSGTTYPGVIQYYRELDRESSDASSTRGDLVFLTARPKVRSGHIEDHTYETLRERGVEKTTILSGDFLHLLGNDAIAEKKYENFVEYRQLFPEYRFVFTGDSGQGDALFGVRIRSDFPESIRGIFIHNVVDTPEEDRADWRARGVVSFDTYVGAAVEGLHAGLLEREGLARVIDAAVLELEAVPFKDDAQKAARAAELQGDVTRARELL